MPLFYNAKQMHRGGKFKLSWQVMKQRSCNVDEFNAIKINWYLQCQDEHVDQMHLSLVWEREWGWNGKSVVKTLYTSESA